MTIRHNSDCHGLEAVCGQQEAARTKTTSPGNCPGSEHPASPRSTILCPFFMPISTFTSKVFFSATRHFPLHLGHLSPARNSGGCPYGCNAAATTLTSAAILKAGHGEDSWRGAHKHPELGPPSHRHLAE